MVGKTVIWKRSECAVHGRRRRRYVVEFPSGREDVRGVAGATLIFQDLFFYFCVKQTCNFFCPKRRALFVGYTNLKFLSSSLPSSYQSTTYQYCRSGARHIIHIYTLNRGNLQCVHFMMVVLSNCAQCALCTLCTVNKKQKNAYTRMNAKAIRYISMVSA